MKRSGLPDAAIVVVVVVVLGEFLIETNERTIERTPIFAIFAIPKRGRVVDSSLFLSLSLLYTLHCCTSRARAAFSSGKRKINHQPQRELRTLERMRPYDICRSFLSFFLYLSALFFSVSWSFYFSLSVRSSLSLSLSRIRIDQ